GGSKVPAEHTPNNPQPSRREKEPPCRPPESTGTLVVRVFASNEKKEHDVVRGAKVKVTGPMETEKPAIIPELTTDDCGEVAFNLSPGNYHVQATAFGQTDHTDDKYPPEVRPKCETRAELVLPVSLDVKAEPVTDAGKKDAPTFYSAGTLIAVHAESTCDNLGDVKFEWTASAGSILEDCAKATGRTIHIDTSSARGPVHIGVTMIGADNASVSGGTSFMVAPAATVPVGGSLNIGLRRSASVVTPDLPLWVVIRNSTDGLSFKNYQRFIDVVLCDSSPEGLPDRLRRVSPQGPKKYEELKKRR